MQLTERHLIRENHHLYQTLDDLTFAAKNLYNRGLYDIRQSIFKRDKMKQAGVDKKNLPKVLSWAKLSKNFTKEKQIDFILLPAKVSQNILRGLGSVISSYYEALKEYQKDPSKFTGKPRLPRYLHKTDGRRMLEFNEQTISNKRGFNGEIILCPKTLNLQIPSQVENPKSVRIVPTCHNTFVIEVVYEVEEEKRQGSHLASIDLGVNNLATVTFSNGDRPLLLDGRKIKSINQGYNRLIAKAQSKLPKNTYSSKYIHRLWTNRDNKLQHEFHVMTRYLSDLFDEMNLDTVVIGKNDGWKQDLDLGSKTNQSFAYIPYQKFISQLTYKCQLKGIKVIEQEESYTSKASFLDTDDIPVFEKTEDDKEPKTYVFSGKRLKRGLYQTASGRLINADVNGSYNIMKKAFPDYKLDLESLSFTPKKIHFK